MLNLEIILYAPIKTSLIGEIVYIYHHGKICM